MTLLSAILMGLVEGITEFLPVSSTAHMIIVANMLGIQQTTQTAFFEIFIQTGAILAALLLYYKLLLTHRQLIERVIESFIPTALIGIFAHKHIKDHLFQSIPSIGYSLIIASIVFIIIEILLKKEQINLKKNLTDLTRQDAFIIGAVQALALFPGVSRAGAVIVAMLILKFKRKDAAIYSFILAIPTIFAAAFFDFIKVREFIDISDAPIIATGLITAFISAYFVIKLFISFVQKQTLVPFAIYRIILAIALLA